MKILDKGYIVDSEKMAGSRRSHMFTTLYRLKSGRLLASFRRGKDKKSADGNCVLTESTDDGRTWREICDGFYNTFEGVDGEIRGMELAELYDGKLQGYFGWIKRTGSEEFYDETTDEVAPKRLITAESKDGGATWEDYHLLDIGPVTYPGLSGAVLRLPDGGYLLTGERQERERKDGPSIHKAEALYSPDGRTFTKHMIVARHPEDDIFYYDQRQTIAGNKLVAAYWTYDRKKEKDIPIHLAWGDAGSLTWEIPFSTGIQGQIAAPIFLSDDRLLLFYVHRHEPCSMRLIASSDGGKSWDRENELVVYSKAEFGEERKEAVDGYVRLWSAMYAWTFGHPTGVVLDDGSLLLAYYAGAEETRLSVRWARVEV